MKLFDNIKLATKMPLLLVGMALLALGVMGFTAYHDANVLLEAEGSARLRDTLEARKQELETWSRSVLADVRSEAAGQMTGRTLREFMASWGRLGEAPADYLVQTFITDNPFPEGARYKLEYPGDVVDYSILHRRYHPGLLAQSALKGYADILLIDVKGNVLYSMAKQANFATNLFEGDFKDGILAQTVRAAMASKGTDPIVSDFARIPEARDAVGAFVVSPVRTSEGLLLGAIAYQLPLDIIDAAMARPTGLGSTGQGYLVGTDGFARSNLRRAPEPTILTRKIDTPGALAALAGNSGVISGIGTDGQTAEMAYDRLEIFGKTYGLVMEQSQTELFAPATRLGKSLGLHASWLMGVLGLVSWLLARSMARPLERVGQSMAQIAARDFSVEVPCSERGDEVGEIARSLENFRAELQQAEAGAQAAALKSAAFEAGSTAVMMVDRDFVITYVNQSTINLITTKIDDFRAVNPSIDAHQLVGSSMDIFHRNAERTRAVLSDSANLPYQASISIGTARFMLGISEVTMPELGRIGFVVEWRDVTEASLTEAVLGAIEDNQLICEFDLAGQVLKVNANFETAVGMSKSDLVGQNKDSLFSANSDVAASWEKLAAKETVNGRFAMMDPAGQEVLLEGSITPVLDRRGAIMKFVMIAGDVTAAQHALRVVEDQNLAMQNSQRAVVEALRISLNRLSEGDLSTRIDNVFHSDYEQLRADFNRATETLADAMQTVIDNAASIEAESHEISNAAEDLSKRTETQAATLEETATALDQLTSSVRSAASGAVEANKVATDARDSAETSGHVVKQAVTAMGEIEESSTKISRIISVIDDIAFQTNLLALNAGVEAARAGEAGRGFAVVASEVRALAQRSSDAAREIDGLISASSRHVRRGVDLVGETGRSLEGILAAAIDIAARMSEIAGSSQEQSASLAEINIAVNQLDQVTQQNAAMFEQTTAASHSLSRGAQALTATTAQFKTGVTQPTAARRVIADNASVEPASLASFSRSGRGAARAKPAVDEWQDF